MGIVEIDTARAIKLLEKGKLKIGWINCRLRKRTMVSRCYRCLDYGHQSRDCKGPDRTHLCFRCGKPGHKAKECKTDPNCMLCIGNDAVNSNHTPGTGECAVFRRALAEAKKKQK